MLNTKFDLYKSEWLDLVFDDRNKAYGAYDLRHHYAGTLNKAMAIAFASVISLALILGFALRKEPVEIYKQTIVDLPVLPPPPAKVEPKKPDPVKPLQPAKQLPAAATTKFVTVVVTDKPVTEEPPKIKELTGNVGPTTTAGVDGPPQIPDEPKTGGIGTAPAGNGNEIVPAGIGLEVNPEPYGGMAAFGKFLGRALHFPAQAQDANVSGRVIMSFVIEKNGELSNITVVRGAGYGFDEEAMRVLKLAKAWKPGIQNGQPVRVRYTIPINFQLPEE